jgi:methylenetetrahydrofolate dehydrogenase (NADP+)/methenyltetrahydrofolate cyclohydrolase
MTEIIDGAAIAAKVKDNAKGFVNDIMKSSNYIPCLVTVVVGDNPASAVYVRNKIKACEEVGIESRVQRYDDTITEAELIDVVHDLNNDDSVDGFIVQLPLPDHINVDNILAEIDYRKDVDGFTPINLGRMFAGLSCYLPATPKGILKIIQDYNISISGKKVVIIGRSNIVGKPLAAMLSQKQYGNAVVTLLHSGASKELQKQECLTADVIIVAVGKPNFLTADMVKDGAAVIDVGINRIPDSSKKSGYRLCGDVDFDNVKDKTSFITPVPGGVGKTTVSSLISNTIKAACNHYKTLDK